MLHLVQDSHQPRNYRKCSLESDAPQTYKAIGDQTEGDNTQLSLQWPRNRGESSSVFNRGRIVFIREDEWNSSQYECHWEYEEILGASNPPDHNYRSQTDSVRDERPLPVLPTQPKP